jgi:AraC-like DNA-binding protein
VRNVQRGTSHVLVRSRSFEPSAPLRDFVRLYRFLTTTATAQVATRPIIARTGLVLTFNLHHSRPQALDIDTSRQRLLPEVLLTGAQCIRHTDIVMTTGWTSFSVHFHPAGAYRLFHLSMRPFTNRMLDAVEVLAPDLEQLHAQVKAAATPSAMYRLVETYLLKKARDAPPLHPVARAAFRMIDRHGAMSIADASRASGLGQRQFERCFVEQLGMPPKVYARVARLNFVLQRKTLHPALDWTTIAGEAGYCDYKHLARDFKGIVGTTPTAYLSSPRRLDDGFLLPRETHTPSARRRR